MSALKSMSQSLKAAKLMKKRHKKLDEDWFDAREPIQDGVRFGAKYLGMTVITEPKGDDAMVFAVQRVISMAKSSKKIAVQLLISSKGIKIIDQTTSQPIADVPIQSISFCSAIKRYLKVFAFVSENAENKNLECHVYLCNSVKEAQALNVTVAQSFGLALEMSEQKLVTGESEKETQKSDFIQTDGEKKPAPPTNPAAAEKRYQRFSTESNPFDSSASDINSPTGQIWNNRSASELDDKGRDIFIFTTPISPLSHQPSKPMSSQPIMPLKPPPASGRQSDKSAPRRPARLGSVGNNPTSLQQAVQTPLPSQLTPDVEDWDQGFADLALSRTQEKTSAAEESSSISTKPQYPPSNPFFSPGNPFTC